MVGAFAAALFAVVGGANVHLIPFRTLSSNCRLQYFLVPGLGCPAGLELATTSIKNITVHPSVLAHR